VSDDGEEAATGPASPGAWPDPPRHLYIHVPFCRGKCDYCAFYSVAAESSPDDRRPGGGRLERFVEAAHAEWGAKAALQRVRRLETVYVGGGTPSLLGEEGLERLLAPFAAGRSPREPRLPLMTEQAEVTVETNPEDATAGYAAWAAARRVRVSLGVQSFDRGLRDTLGRRAAADPVAAFERLRAAGVTNLGIDLIFGIPGQAPADVDRELDMVATLGPEHVSWYELDVAPGTRLARRVAAGDGSDEEQAELYRRIVAGLERLGYRWYEVSNFARPGRRSRHNLAYWRGRSYLGLGPSAVSTVGDLRWRNGADVERYLRAWAPQSSSDRRSGGRSRAAGPPPARQPQSTSFRGNLGVVDDGVGTRETERLDAVTRARERLFLAARIGARVKLSELDPALDRAALQPLAGAGFISLHGGTLSVTRKGRYVANEVCVRLFRDYFSGG
jgi:putative oxygen-independent coproporphyrinogen III oxidase